MNSKDIKVSPLGKTWIFDIDGTIAKHNGYKIDGEDSLLQRAKEFFNNISEKDMIVFITSRTIDMKSETEKFLIKNGIRFDHIIYNAPFGERILINDKKPSGLETAIAINTDRDVFLATNFEVDERL
ncbi:23S rRNA G2445 N2-methylase RlmL [Clostridium saccharoperbutylacetonicum]|uniref:Uncharacterized protein n=1 Tax=Clostridium saccharoperbutylacetonicum N1-4(HMT) TaxID=931276 RepID=M1LYH8_9CLOT|nr:hypothetical protein [Clostridium saccharoperbutylacetonicum]AGF58315.1 hypothetical protein Cspa_c45620 [Clostridium saccharoperbutylacetonicum N1-4(HMT)]NRT60908.1 23S rRNA G2445 N2-methylase RlmL [Clostridium saccharoperbutylacetonicum]NSB24221.1 23S rRNA G2445 N2-methylase RlmL [Clostridium saccharoperbutylacetonicum]NSB43599.1 23S rRNA G2445 N2-methylase RlmL [Clostridium saccharoperbutylacetonicum]